MSGRSDRLAVGVALLALLLAVAGGIAAARGSSADFVVTVTSPANQITTLDPQPPAVFGVPLSRPAGAVELAWTASATAAIRDVTYSVHRRPAGSGSYVQVAAGLTALTHTDTPPADGSYDYLIRTDVSTFDAPSAARTGLSDRTPPSISASASPAANANGWRRTDVTVTFTCTDGGSGVASCSAPAVITAEGAAQSVSGSASDIAGNTASATASGISLDRTAPVAATLLTSAIDVSTQLGAVDLAWTAGSDALSGLDSYRVEYGSVALLALDCSTASFTGSAALSGTAGTVTGLTSGTKYCFRLVTRDRAGNESAPGNVAGPTAAK